jgi:hypothetical protein
MEATTKQKIAEYLLDSLLNNPRNEQTKLLLTDYFQNGGKERGEYELGKTFIQTTVSMPESSMEDIAEQRGELGERRRRAEEGLL